MTTQTKTQECQCSLPAEMSWAGPAAQLCPHSALEPALEVQANLIKLLDDFMQEIPIEDLLNKPLLELGEKYMRDVLGSDFNLMNQREHNVLMIAFLRHVGIAIMTLMSSMVVNRNKNQAKEETKKPARKQSTDILRGKPDPIFDEIEEVGEKPDQNEDKGSTAEQTEDQGVAPDDETSEETPSEELQSEELQSEETPSDATPADDESGNPVTENPEAR